MVTRSQLRSGLYLTFCLLLSGCGDSSAPRESPTSSTDTLRYQWQPGQILHYRFELSQEIEIQSRSQEINNFTRLTQSYRLKPSSTREGLTITMEFGDILASMREGTNQGTYDSSSNAAPSPGMAQLLASSFGRIENQTLLLHLDKYLKIKSIEGLSALTERLTQTQDANLRAMVQSIFSEDSIKKLVYLTPLPAGELVEGYAWPIQETRSFGLLGDTKLDGTARFRKKKNDGDQSLYQIEITGQAKAVERTENQPPFELKSGSFEGQAWFNPELGHYDDSILTYRLDVRPKAQNPAQAGRLETIHVIQKYAVKLDHIEGGQSIETN